MGTVLFFVSQRADTGFRPYWYAFSSGNRSRHCERSEAISPWDCGACPEDVRLLRSWSLH